MLYIDLQGHRGARGLLPENTLPAFGRAVEIGVTTLELDVGMARDGVLMIHHDSRLNPEVTRDPQQANAWIRSPGPLLWALTSQEIQRYDVGRIDPASAYARRFPFQQPRDGTIVPRLIDLFRLVEELGNQSVRFNIEPKVHPERPQDTAPRERMALALIAAIRGARLMERTTVQSFDWRILRLVQSEAPEIATVYLTSEQAGDDTVAPAGSHPSAWTAGLHRDDYESVPHMVRAAGGRIWSPHFRDLSPRNVQAAADLGIEIVAWTVNAPEDLARVLDLGIAGLASDYPDRASAAIRGKGLGVRGVDAPA